MNFLALTSFQAALIALVTTATIVAMYFLKLRHRRVVVSSSMLWRKVLDDAQTRSLWEKLRRVLSLLIAVIIGLLIALALGRPEIPWLTGGSERILVVLDTHPSMLTRTSDGQTRWQRALAAVQSILRSASATAEFRIADTSGRFDMPFTRDRESIERILAQMAPMPVTSFRFPAEIPSTEGRIYFVTDGVSQVRAPEAAAQIGVFEAAPNVGITAFEIRSMPSTPAAYEAYLEVQNFSEEEAEVGITVSGTGRQRFTRAIRLAPGERYDEPFDLTPFESGGVRAAIQSNGDAFPLDDIAYAYLPINRRTRTLLVTSGNSHLETMLKLDSLVELTVTSPANFRESADHDVYIFDGYVPSEAPSRPSLVMGARDAAWLRTASGVIQEPTVDSWMEDHPVMQYVSLHDVSIQRASRIDASGLTVIAASNGAPLIVASERAVPGPRWIMLTFDLQSSDFYYQAAFPIFVENALSWLAREPLATRRSPGVVEVPLENAQIRAIDGTAMESKTHLGRTVFETSVPGLYLASQEDRRLHVAVNLADRKFSAVNVSAQAAGPATPAPHLFQRELWFYMLLAALVLISAEWYTYHRRITL